MKHLPRNGVDNTASNNPRPRLGPGHANFGGFHRLLKSLDPRPRHNHSGMTFLRGDDGQPRGDDGCMRRHARAARGDQPRSAAAVTSSARAMPASSTSRCVTARMRRAPIGHRRTPCASVAAASFAASQPGAVMSK